MSDVPPPANPNDSSPPIDPGATQPLGYPPGYPMQPGMMPQGYPQPMGYPPGYPMQPGMMPQGYPQPMGYPPGYPMQPGMMPQGYPQPQGYPPGYPMQPGMMPQGYPPGYPMMPPPSGVPAPHLPPPPSATPETPVAAPAATVPAPSTLPTPAPSAASGAVPVAVSASAEEAPAIAVGEGEIYHPPALTHIEPVKPPSNLVRFWRRVGGGSLTLSIAIHAGILIVGGAIVVSTQMIQKQVDFLPGGGTQQGAQASAEMKHKVQQKKRTSLNKKMPMKKIVSTSQSSSVTLPDAPPDLLDVPDMSTMVGGGSLGSGGFGKAGAGGGFGTGMGMGGMAGFVSLPPSMKQRCSTTERLEKLRQNGGSPECERAVSASLEWLKTQQNADGSWGQGGGKSNKAAMTGLALLCYLGRCETPDSPFYGDNVMRGIMYLVELSKKNEHGIICEDPKPISGAYEHGIATYALGEMYTLARLGSKELPGMKDAFVKGVELIIKCQNGEGAGQGSWDYYTKNIIQDGKFTSTRPDLSVAAWQYQALKAAKFTGLKIAGLHGAIDKTTEYILRTQTKDGGFGATSRDAHYNQWSLTGAGVLGLQTLSKGKTTSIKKGIQFLRDFLAAEPLDWNKNCNLYCWYYYTQAFFQAGGEDWKFYNEQFLPQILAAQQPDGSFKAGRPNWPSGDARDPVYRQTLCTLQLEVYYRYLKVGDREEENFFDRQ